MSSNAIKKTTGEKIFSTANSTVLILLGIATIFPFYITIINSISPPEDFIFKDLIIWPSKFELGYYRFVLGKGSGLLLAYKVTLFVTVVGTLVNMVITSLTAFALAQKKLPYRSQITLFMVFTMFFGGGMIPAYLLVQKLQLLNSLWSMIIPGALSTGYMLFLRNFIMTIPVELIESAIIDGCSDFGVLIRIILPLSAAAMATFTLFYAVGHWNEFYAGAIYISDYKKQPLQVYLRQVLYDATIQGDPTQMQKLFGEGKGYQPPSEGIKAATIMSATLPIIFIYPFLQKYFVKGMMMGSLKG